MQQSERVGRSAEKCIVVYQIGLIVLGFGCLSEKSDARLSCIDFSLAEEWSKVSDPNYNNVRHTRKVYSIILCQILPPGVRETLQDSRRRIVIASSLEWSTSLTLPDMFSIV